MITRRDFVKSAALVAATPSVARSADILVQRTVRPVVISDYSGWEFTNGGTENAVSRAFRLITEGKDVLDALIAGVNIPENDPLENGIGYGALPNADGVVQLDASCMHGPKKRAGAVACIEGVRTPSLVAQAVMDNTDHHLLAGDGRDGVRARHGLQGRRRPEHAGVAQALARVEAAGRSGALSRSQRPGAERRSRSTNAIPASRPACRWCATA